MTIWRNTDHMSEVVIIIERKLTTHLRGQKSHLMHLVLINGIVSLFKYQKNHTVFSGTFQSHKNLCTMTPVDLRC